MNTKKVNYESYYKKKISYKESNPKTIDLK